MLTRSWPFALLLLALPRGRSVEFDSFHVVSADGQVQDQKLWLRRENGAEDAESVAEDAEHLEQKSDDGQPGRLAVEVAEGAGSVSNSWVQEEQLGTKAVTISLLASTLLVTAVFYLSETEDAHAAAATWRLLTTSISLFAVILLFMLEKKLWRLCIPSATPESKVVADLLSYAIFLLLMFVIPRVLKNFMDRPRLRGSLRVLGMHLIGFAGADAFADILKQDVFKPSCWHNLGGFLLTTTNVVVLILIFAKSREMPAGVSSSSAAEDPAADATAGAPSTETASTELLGSGADSEWLEMCDTMCNQSAGFIIGFLMSMLCRFFITGAPPGDKSVNKISQSEVTKLLGVAIAWTVLAGCAVRFLLPVAERMSNQNAKRVVRISVDSAAMSAAWAVFYLCHWSVWIYVVEAQRPSSASMLEAANLLALTGTLVVFTPMLVFNQGRVSGSGRKMDPMITNCLSLILAYSWETCTYMVVTGASKSVEGNAAQMVLGIFFILLLLVGIMPAWYLYMLPLTEEKEEPVEEEIGDKKEAAGGEKQEAAAADDESDEDF